MAKYTMELREIISTFGRDEVKSWFTQYELSDFLTPEEIAVVNQRGTWDKDKPESKRRLIDSDSYHKLEEDEKKRAIVNYEDVAVMPWI